MPNQTSYQEYLDAGRVGQIVDTNKQLLISRTAELAPIQFGKPLGQGVADDGCHTAQAGDTAIIGVSVRERSAIDDQWDVGYSVRVMKKGVLWVEADAVVVAGDPVHVDLATATFKNAGGVQIENARYDSSGAVGELVKIALA